MRDRMSELISSFALGVIGNNNIQLGSTFGVVQDPISKTLYVVD